MINLSDSISSFDPKERASFRARKSHWIKKGLSPEKAIELALNSSRKNALKLVTLDASASVAQAQAGEGASANYPKAQVVAASANRVQAQTGASANRPQVQAGVGSSDENVQAQVAASANRVQAQAVASASSSTKSSHYEPTQKEISDLMRRLKSVGVMREIRADAAFSFSLPGVKKDAILPSLEMIVSLVIVCGASSLLIAASLEVFGLGWQGWAKALLLEIGIIALYIFKADGRFQWAFSKGAFLFLLVLSFTVLHTGVQTTKAAGMNQYESSDSSLKDLLSIKKQLISSLEALPASYVSKRQPILAQISEIDLKIENKRELLKTAAPASVVTSKAFSEVLMRTALLLLNLIFSHRLVKRMDEIFIDFEFTNKGRVPV